MELKDMPNIVVMIVLVGMLIGVGLLMFSNFGTAASEVTSIASESFTAPAGNATITLANEDMTLFTQVVNASGSVLPSANYVVDLDTGVLNLTNNATVCNSGDTCYASYTYIEYDTNTKSVMDSNETMLGDISNTWLSLIITIIVLAIILSLVVSSFSNFR